ncbi:MULTISPECIES: TraR/DksA C4-type zinc finger protein [Bacillaceae]|uniref:TraR/DksA C4-type zinc finger protein n=2 Tax=Bacillati TaxID=1783272 RepID=UPI001E4183CE|nr:MULTISPECIES: TraR/DksA C4-type zinc finger protein [Bacillaceae]MCE4051779.1 TraR/DksA C4-type zinc finger protein [Bacillus sp. Au-Bac7]MCM3034171.1 TraR/DksA C4-type zinc finger protein [Niallia sp. MER 6]MDL0437161.1 TraR/DksA C4-type zinc finger protein [Niallia sp. SS-2023]UPO87820.1 TraR/DksA C4-type zinc finger protein [Niallia sp. Man26]
MLTKQQLNEFQSLLENEKQDIEERYDINDHLGLIRSHAHDSVGELSSYDNHPGDEGTELYEREKDIALNEHYRFEYAGVVNALKAIENGTYGKCEECGKEIPLERLEALPTARYCIEHTPDQVVSHERPVEEGVLMPPFGKFDMDEQDETVAYDAEDSWQDVESFGTSETPSDFVHPVFDHYNDLSIDSYENVGYVEEYENFVGVDIEGKNITVYPNQQHKRYEQSLDEEGIMTSFGDLPAYEHDPYVEDEDGRER